MKRKILYVFLIVAGLPLTACLGILCYLQLSEYTPPLLENILTNGSCMPLPADKSEVSVLSWNIGYGGLGKEMDYFFDGGKMVRPGKQEVNSLFKGICAELKSHDSVDFIFIQEIDRDSKRTYRNDQLTELGRYLNGYCSVYATNYKVGYIPIPLLEPIGKVSAGLCTFSKFRPENAERHAYDAFFAWPKRLAFLKRCFLASAYNIKEGKQLIVINLHNSAYDTSGVLRRKELETLQTYMETEYRKGNYIIAGGDWNMNPPGFRPEAIRSGDRVFSWQLGLTREYMPGWKLVYDSLLPSNRNVDSRYIKGSTGTTIIDFFIISPNVKVMDCITFDLGFEYSDHNPVYAKFRLLDAVK